MLARDNLDNALLWLYNSDSKQDHSDVWNYSRRLTCVNFLIALHSNLMLKAIMPVLNNVIVHKQIHALPPNKPILCKLIWQFMQRAVERGGNYRDIDKGIPLGASISPLLAALYLIPLDKAFCQRPALFYRRYMDDWVIICHSRQALRNITKEVYTMLKSLHVRRHPDKTWLGKAQHGFDFLGFRITPTRIQPSAQNVSRRDAKIVQLYEQGASNKRIGQYLRRWLGWCCLGAALPAANVFAGVDLRTTVRADACHVIHNGDNTTVAYVDPVFGGSGDTPGYVHSTPNDLLSPIFDNSWGLDLYIIPLASPTPPSKQTFNPQNDVPAYPFQPRDGIYHTVVGQDDDGSVCIYKFQVTNGRVVPSTLTAVDFAVPHSMLTYLGNGNTGGTAPIEANHATDSSVTVDGSGSFVKTGYSFTGWNTAADGTGTTYATGSTFTMPANDLTLYAQWSADSQTLSYNGNGNTDGTAPADASHTTDSSVTVDGIGSFVKTGYSFTGWNTTADATGTTYAAGSSITMPANSLTLYAQWSADSQTLSYNGNGNTDGTAPADASHTTDSSVTVDGSGSFVKTGYSFTGWNTATDGTGTTYADGSTLTMPAESITLYAQWKKGVVTSMAFDTPTGQGTLKILGGGDTCGLNSTTYYSKAQELDGKPQAPSGVTFDQGLVGFTAQNCEKGSTLTVKIEYPNAFSNDATLTKWGKTTDNTKAHWYDYPATISGTTVTYTVIDGGLGDDDLEENGAIIDPVGVGSTSTAPAPAPTTNSPRSVPSLGKMALLLMAALVALTAMFGRQLRRN